MPGLAAAALMFWAGLGAAIPAHAQVSPDEHAKHHPAQAQAAPQPGMPMGAPQGAAPMGPEGGAMGQMEGMMDKMGVPPPKEFYPSLMDLPDLSPEKRAEVERLAHERMKAGAALMSRGLERMASSSGDEDYPALQEATGQVREGLAQFESGLAAHRALREGKAPRTAALQWFKSQMNLAAAGDTEQPHGIFGLSWFHYFVMFLLTAFVAAVIWMYFHKMRRAEAMLTRLSQPPPPGPSGAGLAPPPPGPPPSNPPPGPASGPPAAANPPPAAAAVVPTVENVVGETPPPVAAQMAKWTGRLRVARIFQETPDVKTLRLAEPEGGPLPFTHLPGQYATLTVEPDGKPVKRSYTIASSPTKGDCLEITVKREEFGLVSRYLHDHIKEGDELPITAPSGYFTFTGKESDSIVLIAGGVGLTPMMSVVRYLTDRGWAGDIYLLYSCRTSRDFIFREELEYLQRRHPNLHVLATMTRAEGTVWMGLRGHFNKDLIAVAVPGIASRRVHLCGPPAMMDAVRQVLEELGVPKEQIKTEAFGTAKRAPKPAAVTGTSTEPPVRPTSAQTAATLVAAAPATAPLPVVRFTRSGKFAPLTPDKTVLEAAEEAGVEIDNSCRSGTCGSCKVKLLSGSVTMDCEDALEPGDKAQNLILACQAKASGEITVEA
ncbi:MAG: 2Fe-2S iron-sulfur cluster binding domain-containing protein [Bryobacterales bacterium]|nr:2Fe-2S iron-sulfur cluster binding domain-containing protein [Bryobacterales bacterium]